MGIFSRNKNATIAELEEYYENQRKNRGGMAWAMALFSLLITVGVIAGLFFGGRWTYRVLTNDDTKTTLVIEDKSDKTTDEQQTTGVTNSEAEPGGVVSDSAASTSTPNTSTVVKTPTTSTSSDAAIPNTGPGSFLVIFSLATAAVGYLVARARELNNL